MFVIDVPMFQTDQRNKLLDGHERLMQTSNRLDNIQSVHQWLECLLTQIYRSLRRH